MSGKLCCHGRLVFFLLCGSILLSILFDQPYENLTKPLELYGHFVLIGIFVATMTNLT